MGTEYVYCSRCSNRIGGNEFAKGLAVRRGGRAICSKCMPSVLGEEIAEEQQAVPAPVIRKSSSTRIRALKQRGAPSGSNPRVVRPAAPQARRPAGLIVGLVAGGVVLLGGAVYFFAGSSAPPAEPELPRPAPRAAFAAAAPKSPPPADSKKEDPQAAKIRAALEAARAAAKTTPENLDALIRLWEEAARLAALTPDFKEASAGLEEAKARLAARKAKPAQAALAAPAPAAPGTPPPAAPTGPSKAYLARWKSAIARASGREYAEAIEDLAHAGADETDEASKREAQSDQDEIRRAQRARAEAVAQLARTAVGQKLVLDVRAEGGKITHLEGTVVRIGPSRVELQKKEEKESAVAVEWFDLPAAALAALGPVGGAGGRGLAILCILEGDRAAAERVLGDAPSAIAARYWDYVAEAPANLPKLPPREYEARRLFYPAEREWEKLETRAAAVAKYKSLLEDYTSTAVVKEDPARIKKRAQSAQEYFLTAGALKGSGQFAVAPAPKIDSAWIVKADAVGSDVALTFVDADFVAAQDLTYKCWIYAGGCCAETFLFYLQTTEGTIADPRTGKTVYIEPGGGAGAPVKHGLQGLAKTHAAHKPKMPSKSPVRWEWIPIPLPKYSAPGLKKIRLLSDQQGFAIGAVLVTSKRNAPPSEADLKEELARANGSSETSAGADGGAGGRPWRPLFDGKSLDCLRPGSPGWRLEGSAIAHVPDANDAGQTREEIADGELRIRFEVKDLEQAYFKIRQGSGGGYAVLLEAELKNMEGKPHEILFTAKGETVTATLDGNPVRINVEAPAQKGCLQFNTRGKSLRILALDVR